MKDFHMELRCSFLIAYAFLLFSFSSNADNYTVSIDGKQPRLANVVAKIKPNGKVISMNEQNVHGLKGGWAAFVENLTVSDSSGRQYQIVKKANSNWELQDYTGGYIILSYNVRLGHDVVTPKIKFGDNGAAYATNDGVMWAGRAIFISGVSSADVKVKFNIPDSWAVTTPWEESKDNKFLFITDGTKDLLNSAFFAGTHLNESLTTGNISLRMAFSGEYTLKMSKDITTKVSSYFKYYGEHYASPLKSRMVLIVSDRNDGGGEVMGKAISISVGPNSKDQMDKNPGMPKGIARLIAHELFHGIAFNLLEVDDSGENAPLFEWFNEGFGAEYASQIALLRTGLKNEAEFLEGIVYRMNKYIAETDGKLTLINAGADKADKSTTVYWGGLMAAMSLDFLIRDQTNGKSNLDELWRYLLKKYPKGGKVMTLNAIYQSTDELYGNSISSALKEYSKTAKVIPFYKNAQLMGLEYDGETLSRSITATNRQKELWQQFLGL
jgi:predicted metalloprotease with PDZ domain